MNAEIPKMCPHEIPYEQCPSIACKTRLRAFAAPTGLEVLRKYWNERIQRKRTTAQKMSENGEYALAHRLSVEADATELCLKDLETESTSNDQAQAQRREPKP